MQQSILRAGVSVVFVGMLAMAAVLSRSSARGGGGDPAAAARYGFRLEDVTSAAGIDFAHQAPRLDPKLEHIMPEVASMGAGVAVADFDRDGWTDFYVTNSGEGSRNRLYRNRQDGTFEDVAEKLGVADVNGPGTGVSMGAVWGDYDNDGFEDLFVYKWGRPELFHNDAGRGFTRATGPASLPGWVNANSAVWFDYDRDGKLDLFLAGYYRDDLDLWNLRDTRMMPESFEYARNGGRKYLYHNLGGGRFEEVSERLGLRSNRWALAAAAADLRRTGYPDLVIANDYGVTEFFANEGGRRFREIGGATRIGDQPKSGMNVAFGDVTNQGRFAIQVSNITEPGVLVQGNNLWVARDGAAGDRLRYDNLAETMGVEQGGWSFGAQFGDLNNDGRLDLLLTNGYVSASREENYWYDFAKVAGGNSAIIGDARNWPPIRERSHAGYQQKCLWLNQGDRFIDVAPMVGLTHTYDGRAVALADFWNRGALDVVMANQKAPLVLYRNQANPGSAWIAFELEGTVSNRSAVGAEVRVFWNGQEQLQQVSGGVGFCAQNQRRLHFGLGHDSRIEQVHVRWPSGKEQTLTGLAPGQLHRLKEPA